MEKLDYKYKIAVILVAAILINIFLIKSALLGYVIGVLYLLFFGYLCGCSFFPRFSRGKKMLLGTIILLILFILIGSLLFYLSILTRLAVAVILIIIPIILIHQIPKIEKIKNPKGDLPDEPAELKTTYMLVCLYTIFFTVILCFLQFNATSQATRSIWQAIPPIFFIFYSLNTILLLAINFTAKQNLFKYLAAFLHFFLTFSLVINIYPLGFGFDSIIHQATEKIIFTTGSLSPLPFYYAGHYSLVVFLAHLTQISVEWIDKLLLPILLSIFLPGTILMVLNKKLPDPKNIFAILPVILLILPYKNYIVTTPQAVANVLLVILLFLAINKYKEVLTKKDYFLFILFSLAIALIHPLAGLCSFIFIIIFILVKTNLALKTKIIIISLFSIISSFAIPMIFRLSSFLSGQIDIKIHQNSPALITNYSIESNAGNILLNLVYLYKYFFIFFFLAFALVGLVITIREKKKSWGLLFLPAIIIFINGLLTQKYLDFGHLIAYEKNDYSMRLFEISLFFLIPLFLITWFHLFKKFKNFKQLTFIFLVLITLMICFNIYLSYPHHDKFETSGLYNIGYSDIKAVSFIQHNCQDDCIVLANQTVSAAAIQGYGFKKSYQTKIGEIFYYPVPTGGPLYQYYLQMIEDPKKNIMKEARELTGAKTSYFVVNDYWWNSEKIILKSQEIANAWTKIDNGKVWIFKFID